MARFLADLKVQVLAEKKLAKPLLKYALDSAELPEGIMVLNVDEPLESQSKLIQIVLVPIDIRVDDEFNENAILQSIRNKVKNNRVFISDIEILGEVHIDD